MIVPESTLYHFRYVKSPYDLEVTLYSFDSLEKAKKEGISTNNSKQLFGLARLTLKQAADFFPDYTIFHEHG